MFFRFTRDIGCFLCQHLKINIFFKRGKIKIYQYFDYSGLEKNAPIKKSKPEESQYVYRRIHNICIQSQI